MLGPGLASNTYKSGVLIDITKDDGCCQRITHLEMSQLTNQNQVFQRAL